MARTFFSKGECIIHNHTDHWLHGARLSQRTYITVTSIDFVSADAVATTVLSDNAGCNIDSLKLV